MISSRVEIKEQAKKNLQGKYGVVIPIILIFGLIQSAIGTIQNQFTAKYSIDWETMTFVLIREARPFLSFVFSLLGTLVAAIVLYSLAKVFIQLARNETPVIEEAIVVGVKMNPIKLFVITFLLGLFVFLWSLLFIIPGIVKSYAYSMTYYLLHLKPDLSASDTITMSKEYTRGYKMDLFILDLSYFFDYFIGLFTLGIYWLWVIPRHSTARTLFYEEIYLKNNPVAKMIEE